MRLSRLVCELLIPGLQPQMAILPSAEKFVPSTSDGSAWQRILAEAVRDLDELCRLVELSRSQLAISKEAASDFPLLVPRGYIARMERGNPDDPLLRQVLPIIDENKSPTGFLLDPVADRAALVAPGLLQKYPGRVLIVTTGACAVHCRYCFRRHFDYRRLPDYATLWASAIKLVAADRSIHEVILSGGDPLTLADDRLSRLATRLGEIPHLRRLRIHTRLPILIPQRVCEELLGWLTAGPLAPIMVIHANHAAELSSQVGGAIARLVDAGVPVLNQAVLLRGVNDNLDALQALCQRLVDLRVMPYYLHQLDRVDGAAHFEVPEEEGKRLIAKLRSRLPGYAIPRYVREVAGELSKTPLD